MTTTVICPHCNEETEVWLGGGVTVFDCQKCGEAFSYTIPKPPAFNPATPSPPLPQFPSQINVSHTVSPPGFGRVFRVVLYVCGSLVLLAIAAIFGLAFLGAASSEILEAAAKTRSEQSTAAPKQMLPPLSEAESRKIERFIRLIESRYDKVEQRRFYGSFTLANNLRVYCGSPDGGKPYLRMELVYYGDDWVFFNRVILRADDRRMEYAVVDPERDQSGGNVWEVADIAVREDEWIFLLAVLDSQTTIVRFAGSESSRDLTITPSMKSQIMDMLQIYRYLGGSVPVEFGRCLPD